MAYNLEHIDPDERTEGYGDHGEAEEARRPAGWLRPAIAVAVMAVFAGGLWFAYLQGKRHAGEAAATADIPLIRADTRPFKVKPDHPGGMQIPDRDLLIYGERRPQVEHLLPPPEQPMARPTPPPAIIAPPPTVTPAMPQSPAQAAAPTAGAAPQLQTAPLPEATVPPAAPSAAVPAPKAATAPANSGGNATRVNASADPIGDKIQELAVLSGASPGRSTAERVAAGRPGGLRLQLGAVRTESQARGEWERLKHQNADLLGRLSGVAIRADLGDKGVYYRIMVGPIADPSTADRLCAGLRQRHLACMIAR
jgi:hypothetical protein